MVLLKFPKLIEKGAVSSLTASQCLLPSIRCLTLDVFVFNHLAKTSLQDTRVQSAPMLSSAE